MGGKQGLGSKPGARGAFPSSGASVSEQQGPFPPIRDWEWGPQKQLGPQEAYHLMCAHLILFCGSMPSFCLVPHRICPYGHRLSDNSGVQEMQLKWQSVQKFINKVLLEHSHTHSFMIDCLAAFMAQQQNLSSWDRNYMACKVRSIYSLVFHRRTLTVPLDLISGSGDLARHLNA